MYKFISKIIYCCLGLLATIHCSFAQVPDFAAIDDIPQRQAIFFDYISHYAQIADQAILDDRNRIGQLHKQWQNGEPLSAGNQRWLHQLSNNYLISDFNLNDEASWQKLFKSVDIVPISLVLAQAADESGWGTSRFAQQGLNFFGQWCYQPGCGLVPLARPEGATYEVRKYSSTLDSVNSYIHNLNTSDNYQQFRDLRYQQRQQTGVISGYELVEGLTHYSELREQYVDMIQTIICVHDLGSYDKI